MITANWVTNESGRTVANTSFFSFNTEDIHGTYESPFVKSFKGSEIEIGKLTQDAAFSKVVNFAIREIGFIHLATKVLHGKVDRYKCLEINGVEFREKGGLVYTRKV